MAKTLEEAIGTFDRAEAAARRAKAESIRREFLTIFPETVWPTLPLQRYALGQDDSTNTYCRWLEFRTPNLGSIGGGSSAKHIIYKRRNAPGWYFPQQFVNEEEAWTSLRADVVTMLQRAHAGEWAEMESLMPFQYGPALWLKTLHLYLPDEILSVYSRDHLAHFLYRLTGEDPRQTKRTDPVRLNKRVLAALRGNPKTGDLSTLEMSYFLYHWDDPRLGTSIYKIAPGEDARFWEQCLAGEYMCVGWGKVGDLSGFENFAAFKDRFEAEFSGEYGQTPAGKATMARKAKELWRLTQINPGDRIVANKGMSRILGVGEVQDPPYEWAGDVEYPHRIRVKWDTQAARSIPTQQKWAFVTIAPIPLEEYERMFSGGTVQFGPGPAPVSPAPVADPQLATMGALLDDRRQLILYGPPGTGKTYTARRLILYWLLSAEGHSPAEILADPQRSRNEWNRLLTLTPGAAAAQLTMVTFHPSYSYEDFVEGYRPVPSQDAGLRLQLEDGVFKRVCAAAAAEPSRRFALLIDEINRGNLPRIFGELITVIEADKRGMPLTLPQSKRPFAVPPNVYIVGTMNTADRSIRVLDAAIRRRFAFCELMPDSTLLSGSRFRDLALDDFLDFLNAAIARREGREKQIGHAVFMDADGPVDTIEEFAKRFRYEVIPLLQEYCYEDYRALMEYIGPDLVEVEAQQLKDEVVEEPEALVDALAALVNRETTD